jgi:hypothetical protein
VDGHALREEFCVARVCDALADAEQDAQDEDHREARRQTGEHGSQGPQSEAATEHVAYVEALRQPACDGLQGRIRPEEGRKEYS